MFRDADQHQHWLAIARRYTPAGIDAADVLQQASLAAIKARRFDLSSSADQRYFRGILRKTAWAMRRAEVRRRRREQSQPSPGIRSARVERESAPDLSQLPQSLQAVANLVMANLDQNEIHSALGIGNEALRRRLSDLRRYIERHSMTLDAFESARKARHEADPSDIGLMRQALIHWLSGWPESRSAIGTVDPDGHLIDFTGTSTPDPTNPDQPTTEGRNEGP